MQTKINNNNNNSDDTTSASSTAEGLCCSPSPWCLAVPRPWCCEMEGEAWSEELNSSRGAEQHGRFGEGERALCPSLSLHPSAEFVTAAQGLFADLGGRIRGSPLSSPEESVCFSKHPALCTSLCWQSCWRSQDLSRSSLGLGNNPESKVWL